MDFPDYLASEDDEDHHSHASVDKKVKAERKDEENLTSCDQSEAMSIRSLARAHDELEKLSQDLQRKSKKLLEKEYVLLQKEHALKAKEDQLELDRETVHTRSELLRKEEVRLERKMKEEERMLAEDAKAMKEVLKVKAKDELDSLKEKVEVEKEALYTKIQTLQSQLKHRKVDFAQLQERYRTLYERNATSETKLSLAEELLKQQDEELDRVHTEVDNLRKKMKVQGWRFDKMLEKQLRESRAPKSGGGGGNPLAQSQRSALSVVSGPFQSQALGTGKSVGEYLLLLVDGLSSLVLLQTNEQPKKHFGLGLSKRSKSSNSPFLQIRGPVDHDLFVHYIFPGISHALELNAVCGSKKTCKSILSLTLFCIGNLKSKPDSSSHQPSSYTPPGDANNHTLATRVATRLLSVLVPNNGSPSIRQGVGDGEASLLEENEENSKGAGLFQSEDRQVRCLAAMTSISVHNLKKPLEPGSLFTSLQALAKEITSDECQNLLVLYPSAIEVVLGSLKNANLPAWHLCTREASTILLSLSRKGPLQAEFTSIITQASIFQSVAIAALEMIITFGKQPKTLTLGESENTSPAFLGMVCEAASVVTVYMQRLTLSSSGKAQLHSQFRKIDLVGDLTECIRIVQGSIKSSATAENKESEQFFVLNCRAILSALS